MRRESFIALFGEAERGEFSIPQVFTSLPRLHEGVGNPPPDSLGIFFGIQALLFDHDLLFFRVKEEGYSYSDYIQGLGIIRKQPNQLNFEAICVPGLGDEELIHEIASVCEKRKSILILTESDLYDYLLDSVG